MDEPIPIRPYPIGRSFASIEEAVADAVSHPRLPEARRDSEFLAGSLLVDACWTVHDWMLRFENGLQLCVWPEGAEVHWQLVPPGDEPNRSGVLRVGSPPIRLRWLNWLGLGEMDCSALIAKRRGACFDKLFINHTGLFLYFRDHLILEFHAVQCETDGRSMLYVCEDH
jgi:hypothetical protein